MYYYKGGSSWFLFGIIILEILVARYTPSIGETFGEILSPLRQMGYMPRPCPNMARKFGFGPKMTELWAKNTCPYMGARTILDYNSALKWVDFNIFAWNLFYKIHRHKTHNCKVRSRLVIKCPFECQKVPLLAREALFVFWSMRTMLPMWGLGAKMGKKPKYTPKEIELWKCHHSICLEKQQIKKKSQNRIKNDRVMPIFL